MADDKVWDELNRAHGQLTRDHMNPLVVGDAQIPAGVRRYDPEACFRTLCAEDRELSHMLRNACLKSGNMDEGSLLCHGDGSVYDGSQSRTQHVAMMYCTEHEAFTALMRYERNRSPVLFDWGQGESAVTPRELSRHPKDILTGPFVGSGRFLSRVSKVGYKQGKMLRQLISECRMKAQAYEEEHYDEERYVDEERYEDDE